MEEENGTHYSPFQSSSRMSGTQLVLVTQFMQLIGTMRHIDEVFSWLAQTCVQRFGLQAMQFWSRTEQRNGYTPIELRTAMYHSTLPSTKMLIPDLASRIASYIFDQRHGLPFTPAERGFSNQQADFMKQHGFNYFGGSYYCGPSANSLSDEIPGRDQSNTPFAVATVLFAQQEPSLHLLLLVENVLERTMPIAASYGLLGQAYQATPTQSTQPLTLIELIPVYVEDETLKSSNPFANTIVLDDKLARRIYAQIDGRKTVAALLKATRLSLKEALPALKVLLNMRIIQFYTAKGEIIEHARIQDAIYRNM